jgi:MraZ protein
MVMTEAYFQQVYERINAMNLTDPTARILRRMLLANAYPVEVDKVGRVLVPSNLREFAALSGNAVIAGQGGFFEVWAPAEWEKQTAEINDIEANNQRFATLNLSSN